MAWHCMELPLGGCSEALCTTPLRIQQRGTQDEDLPLRKVAAHAIDLLEAKGRIEQLKHGFAPCLAKKGGLLDNRRMPLRGRAA